MSAKLVIIGGPGAGQTFALNEDGAFTIGRGDSARFRVPDPAVSREHCILEYYGERAVLKDNASKTGTRVNGKPVIEHVLEPEEIINVGATRMRFQLVPKAYRPPSEPRPEESEDHQALRKLSGTRLAHFDIGSVIAMGKSGVVFVAQDTKEDREVALKIYLPEFAEKEEDLQRFIRAVRTMLPMRHSNVVTLYGGGKTGPHCWMSMEYVEGECLTETIARIGRGGKIDWRPALRVASEICRGLHYIHTEKIIHRNLSPGNILFAKTGTVKLGSLILAKALSGALAKDVTVGGDFLGDVRFLAPEQVGGGGAVDGRADIYSLGTLFFALLTGRAPFEGKSPMETATWILQRDPVPVRKYNPQIPERVEKIVLKLLAKKPDDRYQTAADLLAELEQLPSGA